MLLFIDAISTKGALILFDDNKIINESLLDIKGKEYNNLLEKTDEFLKSNSLNFGEITGIAVINGPGGFTGTRVITLMINTLIFVYGIPVDAIDYFRFLELSEIPYPIIIKANRSEYLIKTSSKVLPVIKVIDEMDEGEYFGIGDKTDFENKNIYIKSNGGYSNFIRNYVFEGKNDRIEPIYIKKPNIT
ncbi:MAG: hypothetical protein PHS92_04115 [Candidatus Gracilibacteria bacterium]|nr:hypothetical protein [Candidatus Gracilibacteria bacterium]